MDRNQFVIQKFERHHPDVLKLIEDYSNFAIERNLEQIYIPVNFHTVPKLDPNKDIPLPQRFPIFEKMCEEMTQYLITKGYSEIRRVYPQTVEMIDGNFGSGHVLYLKP